MDHFQFLHLDVFPLIFQYLSFSELIVALFVCKLFGRQSRRLFDDKLNQVADEAKRYFDRYPLFSGKIGALYDLFIQGSTNVARWFETKLHFRWRILKTEYSEHFYFLCGAKGNLELAKLILQNFTCSPHTEQLCSSPNRIASGAIIGGHVKILYWLRDILGCNHFVKRSWASTAARYGHLKMVKPLIETFGCQLDRQTIVQHAIEYGDLETLQYVWKKHPYLEPIPARGRMCSLAAGAGQLNVLKWLRTNGFCWTSGTTTSAAQNGSMEVLRWAYENGCKLDPQAASAALERGDLVMKQWLHERGCQ